MRFRHRAESDREAGIDMTPLIDIVFIMLIFFVLTASFENQQTIAVDRPSANTADRSEKKGALIVSIDASGMIWFENRNVAKSELTALIRYAMGSQTMTAVVNADKKVESGLLIEVVDRIRMAGVGNVAIATQTAER